MLCVIIGGSAPVDLWPQNDLELYFRISSTIFGIWGQKMFMGRFWALVTIPLWNPVRAEGKISPTPPHIFLFCSPTLPHIFYFCRRRLPTHFYFWFLLHIPLRISNGIALSRFLFWPHPRQKVSQSWSHQIDIRIKSRSTASARDSRHTDGRTDGQTDGQTDGRTLPSTLSPSLRGR